jgi:hypothetical protein
LTLPADRRTLPGLPLPRTAEQIGRLAMTLDTVAPIALIGTAIVVAFLVSVAAGVLLARYGVLDGDAGVDDVPDRHGKGVDVPRAVGSRFGQRDRS